MNMLAKVKKGFIGSLAAVFLLTVAPLPAAQAAIVGTDAAVAQAEGEAVKARLHQLLARDDVRQALVDRGIDPREAQSRVDALTPAEAQQLAGRLDDLPAGGNTIVGAIVFIFVLLLITDLLGLTDFYPFTR